MDFDLTLEDTFYNERIIANSMETDYGKITLAGTPFKMSRTPGEVKIPPPWLGEGNYSAYEFLKIDYDVNSVNFNMITAERMNNGLVAMKDWMLG